MREKKRVDERNSVDRKLTEKTEKLPQKKPVVWAPWVALAVCVCFVVAALLCWRQTASSAEPTAGEAQVAPQAGGQSEVPSEETGELPTVQIGQMPTIDGIQRPTFGPNPVITPGKTEGNAVILHPLEQVRYVRTNSTSYRNGISYPVITVIGSRQELEAYYNRYKGSFRLDSGENAGFWKLCEAYDDAFFAEQNLILALVEEGSGSTRHEVQGLGKAEDGTWQILGLRKIPEAGTADLAQWHILMPVSKNIVTAGDSFVMSLTNVIEDGRS